MSQPCESQLEQFVRANRNAELFRRVADHVENHPDNYEQGLWCVPLDDTITSVGEIDLCDTRCCIAGTAAFLKGWRPLLGVDDDGDYGCQDPETGAESDWFTEAQEALGITESEADVLFDVGWEPPAGLSVADALRSYADGAPIKGTR